MQLSKPDTLFRKLKSVRSGTMYTLATRALIILMVAIPFSVWGVSGVEKLGLFKPPLREDAGEMVQILGGEFKMGGDSHNAPEEHLRHIDTFRLDKHEVTNALYQKFVAETGHAAPWDEFPAGKEDYPVTHITWADAQAYCYWAGRRLPTEAEWEKAARGEHGHRFPWGDEWIASFTNTRESELGRTHRVGQYLGGVSIFGAHDLAGNVWEWVDDGSAADAPAKVIRGGSWSTTSDWAEGAARREVEADSAWGSLGFRCAR